MGIAGSQHRKLQPSILKLNTRNAKPGTRSVDHLHLIQQITGAADLVNHK
jgi:hypothetical protein